MAQPPWSSGSAAGAWRAVRAQSGPLSVAAIDTGDGVAMGGNSEPDPADRFWDGRIDEGRRYHTAFSDGDVEDHYDAMTGGSLTTGTKALSSDTPTESPTCEGATLQTD